MNKQVLVILVFLGFTAVAGVLIFRSLAKVIVTTQMNYNNALDNIN
jgi:uncharacterized membrane protein YjgN (DUF898 family)